MASSFSQLFLPIPHPTTEDAKTYLPVLGLSMYRLSLLLSIDIYIELLFANLRGLYIIDLFARMSPVAVSAKHTLISFDFDGSLVPYMNPGQTIEKPTVGQIQAIANLLKTALSMTACDVIILTNAMKHWVSRAVELYLPDLVYIFNSIAVVSAQDTYSYLDDNPENWKLYAFNEQIARRGIDLTHVISIGDSDVERKAAFASAQLHGIVCKSIKLAEGSSWADLQVQHDMISKNLGNLVALPTSIDMQLKFDQLS
jgi:hypothetical protein